MPKSAGFSLTGVVIRSEIHRAFAWETGRGGSEGEADGENRADRGQGGVITCRLVGSTGVGGQGSASLND